MAKSKSEKVKSGKKSSSGKGAKSKSFAQRLQFYLGASLFIGLVFLANLVFQFSKKPSEFLGLFQNQFFKTPSETWRAYGKDFVANSTAILSPDFLAALAQSETQGNPIARTYWKWRLTEGWQKIFAPASSAVGMFQITTGTFQEARNFCLRNGQVYRRESESDSTCPESRYYSRLIPSHSIEMTSARLHYLTEKLIGPSRMKRKGIGLEQKQNVAAIIHLCGEGAAQRYISLGFSAAKLGRCGDHSSGVYLQNLKRLKLEFRRVISQNSVVDQPTTVASQVMSSSSESSPKN